jgi:hypothetical protein
MRLIDIPYRILCGIGFHRRTVKHENGDGLVCTVCHRHFTAAEIQAEMHTGAIVLG